MILPCDCVLLAVTGDLAVRAEVLAAGLPVRLEILGENPGSVRGGADCEVKTKGPFESKFINWHDCPPVANIKSTEIDICRRQQIATEEEFTRLKPDIVVISGRPGFGTIIVSV